MKYVLVVMLLILFLNCKNETSKTVSAQSIVDTSIAISGGDLISSSTIHFDFRDKHYKSIRSAGSFQLERDYIDSTSVSVSHIKDVIDNYGFQRFVDNLLIEVPDSIATRYAASVNSVHYFSLLPYGLNDKAVHKTLLDTTTIKGTSYHTIKVTFNKDGGGEDYEDVFIYWVNQDTNKVDYLAYSYNESDGKGIRFREAYNERYVEGVRFVDYNNYKPKDASTISLTELPLLFENKDLQLLSKIELENISVKLN